MVKGFVKNVSPRGFCFVKITDNESVYYGEDIFLHSSRFINLDFNNLKKGDMVDIGMIKSTKKGLLGDEISLIEGN